MTYQLTMGARREGKGGGGMWKVYEEGGKGNPLASNRLVDRVVLGCPSEEKGGGEDGLIATTSRRLADPSWKRGKKKMT